MEVLGYFLAGMVGVSLGLIGSGGSILTIPILVYVLGIDPVSATAYSLFVVGCTSLVGGIQNAIKNLVDFKTVLIFGLPSVLVVYCTRIWLLPMLPDNLISVGDVFITKSIALMLLFAVVMVMASAGMIRKRSSEVNEEDKVQQYNHPMILLEGSGVGLLTGLVGAGGGFLIIPALVLLAKMPVRKAIGTSLFIIAINSLMGFIGDLQGNQVINWKFLIAFTAFSVFGIFVGVMLSKKVRSDKLKISFGWFVLVMGFYIIIKEAFFHL